MHDHGPKLMVFVAALFLVVGAVSVQDASAGSEKKTCIKEDCKTPKKSCLNKFSDDFKTAKADCKAKKVEDLGECAGDKQCKKEVKLAFKQCKKDTKLTFKESKAACKNGFKDCKICCKTLATGCNIETCGDGVVVGGEECDDGNTLPGDGCSAECKISCDCCALGATYLEATVVPGSGICGTLEAFHCSNDADTSCKEGDNTDCDFGTCETAVHLCYDGVNTGPACNNDGDCQGTCEEFLAGNLPLELECGGLYTGGGLNAVPLPLSLPDTNKVVMKILSCDSATGDMVLGSVAQGEESGRFDKFTCSEGRKCSADSDNPGDPCILHSDCPSGECEDLCLFGAPLPVPNANTAATSVCAINVVEKDASGTGTCGGESLISAALRSVIYLNGDLLQSSTPPNVPGIQPCPLCVRQCLGGTKKNFPCEDDSECPGSSCDSVTRCLGGLDTGSECEQMTSNLGESYPTSHNCQNDPLQDITESIGGLPVDFAMTTGSLTASMPQHAVDRPNGARVFCGFCRDVTSEGAGASLCFEGDKSATCPVATPPADGNAVPCDSDADCNDGDEYESCVQRNPGAFAEAAATSIKMQGTPAECLADGTPKRATTVGTFCIPPTFNPTVDSAGDLPGPGAVSLQADAQLVP